MAVGVKLYIERNTIAFLINISPTHRVLNILTAQSMYFIIIICLYDFLFFMFLYVRLCVILFVTITFIIPVENEQNGFGPRVFYVQTRFMQLVLKNDVLLVDWIFTKLL